MRKINSFFSPNLAQDQGTAFKKTRFFKDPILYGHPIHTSRVVIWIHPPPQKHRMPYNTRETPRENKALNTFLGKINIYGVVLITLTP
jgi:hypothetical protein